MLAEGAGKTRGTKTGGVEKSGTWANCIITSGEQPITNNSSGGGAVNRIIEVECKEKIFTNARDVAEVVRGNYGFIGKEFVERLQEPGGIEEAELVFNVYKAIFEKQNTTEKQVLAISLILTADELSSRWVFHDGQFIKATEVPDFLHTKESVSVNARAYDYVCEYVAANRNKFIGHSLVGEVWGDIDTQFMYIIRSQFNRICEEARYNSQSLLSWMKQNEKIEAPDKKYNKTKRINGEAVHCVWMIKSRSMIEDLPDEDDSED